MILVNGEVTGVVPATDRGLAYGDGLFETMAATGGMIPHWSRHLRRLQDGCLRLQIPAPDASLLEREIATALRGEQRAVLKLIVTRGTGQRGYRPAPDPSPTRILQRLPRPATPHAPARLGVCAARLGRNPLLAGIKHLNRLEQVLGAAELDGLDVDEAVMRDEQDRVIAGTRTNVFAVRGTTLYTPDLAACGIAGVMRGLVLEHAGACGLATSVRALTLGDLAAADELFLTNALVGIWPVASLATGDAARHFAAGPVTAALRERFATQGLAP